MTEHPPLFPEDTDPLLRQSRIEAAHQLGNSMIDVINAHARTHGAHDPLLAKVFVTAILNVVDEIRLRIDQDFDTKLAALLITNYEDRVRAR